MSDLVPYHGVSPATAAGRPNIRAVFKHYLAPYGAAEPFEDLIETVRKNTTPARRGNNQRPSAAIEIKKAVGDRLDAVTDARDRLSVVLLAPDEEDVRAVIATMMMVFPTPPTESSSFFVDAMVMELREGKYSLAAVAAAARESWQTLSTPPAISTFLALVRKHQAGLEAVMHELGDVLEAADWADDQIESRKTGAS